MAGVAPQMAAAPVRPCRDLHPDRRNLYADFREDAGPCLCDVASGRRLGGGGGRHPAETVFPGTLRPPLGRPLPRNGVERGDRLRRLPVLAAATCVLVSHRRWPALQFRGNLPRMAAASLSERDLAFFRALGRGVPLHRGAQSRAGLTAISKTQVPPCR